MDGLFDNNVYNVVELLPSIAKMWLTSQPQEFRDFRSNLPEHNFEGLDKDTMRNLVDPWRKDAFWLSGQESSLRKCFYIPMMIYQEGPEDNEDSAGSEVRFLTIEWEPFF